MFVLLHVLYATVNELVTYILRYINVSNNNFMDFKKRQQHRSMYVHIHRYNYELWQCITNA